MRALALLVTAAALLRRRREPLLLLENQTNATGNGTGAAAEEPLAVIADGFSRVACVVDKSPDSVRTVYDDGNMRRPKMSPTECFTFCMDKEGMRFFLIQHGRDCYCTEYYHDVTAGGGDCDLPCEGDHGEMCGGKVKASAFEMHMCGKKGSLADAAAASARAEASKANESATKGYLMYAEMSNISSSWQLGICSKSPEVCEMSEIWLSAAHDVRDAAQRAFEAMNASLASADAVDAAKSAGFDTAESAVALDGAVAAAREEMRAAAVSAQTVESTVDRIQGPLGSAPEVDDWQSLFTTASTMEDGDPYSAVCTLQRLPGKSFVAHMEPVQMPPSPPPDWTPPPPPRAYPAGCADACIAIGDECVGFNYQTVTGAGACQFLSDEGVFTPEDSLGERFGIFEVSAAKVYALGYDEIGCFVKEAFLARDGGIKPEILEVIYDVATNSSNTTAD